MVVIVWAGLEADLNGTHTCCCCFTATKSSCAFLRVITNKRCSVLVPPARNLALDRDTNKGTCFPWKLPLSNISKTNRVCLLDKRNSWLSPGVQTCQSDKIPRVLDQALFVTLHRNCHKGALMLHAI